MSGFRGFGVVAVTATAVPVFLATTLGAASPVIAPDPFNTNNIPGSAPPFGSIEPGTNVPPATLQVGATTRLRQGDRIIVCNTDGTLAEGCYVMAIVDSTHIKVSAGKGNGLTVSHVTGSLVIINNNAAQIVIQADATSAAIVYIGTAQSVAAGDPSVIYELGIPVASPTGELPKMEVNMANMGNSIETGQLWMVGNTGKVVPNYYEA